MDSKTMRIAAAAIAAAAVMAGCSAIFIRKYLKLRKKHELYISIIYVFGAAAFLISWILQLAK